MAPDGPEYEALAKAAADNGVYLAGNHYETDPKFPDLYFQGCIIFSPFGELVLRYRRLISMFSPSPFDVWDKYLEMVCLQQSGPLFELVPAPTEVLGSGGPALALAS